MHFEKKYQVQSLNISELIDSEKHGYLNARKLPFYNTCGESTCSWVINTAEISTAALSLFFCVKLTELDLKNNSFSQM